jgi:hypothetical protein
MDYKQNFEKSQQDSAPLEMGYELRREKKRGEKKKKCWSEVLICGPATCLFW